MSRTNERGAALITSLVVMIVLFGLAMSYSTLSYGGYESSQRDVAKVRARMAAQEGMYLSIAELKTGIDTGGDGIGNVVFTGPDERFITATAQDLADGLFRVHSVGTTARADLAAEALVQIEPVFPITMTTRAAVSAKGPVSTLGTIEIDGRDWDYAGTSIVGSGTYGISSMESISNGGSSKVGGNGLAPVSPPLPGSLEENATWANGIDDDGDGSIDEESYDGIDNDGDGLLDEDVFSFPTSPDAAVGQPPGSLLAEAQAAGTYFDSASAWNDYIDANGGSLPGGKIFYLDFKTWQPADLGPTMNDPPSIIVHHTTEGDALMKNVHGQFRGLIFADFLEHINGDFVLLGALVSFADDTVGTTLGNGNAHVLFSSQVLMNLPQPEVGEMQARVLSWSHANRTTGGTP